VSRVSSALSTTANQSLLITATTVTLSPARTADPCSSVSTDDENKKWSLGHMLKYAALKDGIEPSTYVSAWMNAWTSGRTVNGQTVAPMLGPATRDNWQRFAGGSTALPLHKAPFWLLAIVNRIDLRKHRGPGGPLGGEVRFIFGFLTADANNPPCPTMGYDAGSTIILEYSPNKTKENDVKDYASRWLALSSLSMSGGVYKPELEKLTEEVVKGGRLLRIRTNEGPSAVSVGGSGGGRWDLGEFEPDPVTHLLRRSTIKQAPTMALATGSGPMSNWIWANRGDLFTNAFDFEVARSGNRAVTDPPIGSYLVPDTLSGGWFRGGLNTVGDPACTATLDPGCAVSTWQGPLPTDMPSELLNDWIQARFRFSVGTCAGCHSGDTNTQMLHIFPQEPGPGAEANRSPLLSGPLTVDDPAFPGFSRSFDEMQRRENDLRNLVNGVPVGLPVLGNNYTVRFQNSGKCMDSIGNTTNNGALSQLYTCNGEGNQRLSLVSVGTGVYNLVYEHSGKCVDVVNAATNLNARVEQRTCDPTRASQKLTLGVLGGSVPNPRFLKFQHSDKCLQVLNQGLTNGSAIVQGTCPTSNEFAKGFHLVE